MKEILDERDFNLIKKLESEHENMYRYDVKVKNPNNPSRLLDCILIRVEMEAN